MVVSSVSNKTSIIVSMITSVDEQLLNISCIVMIARLYQSLWF